MNIKVPLIIFTLLFSTTALSGDLRKTKPEKMGISSQRLERLEAMNQRHVDEGKLAGVLTMIARKGKIVHVDGAGSLGLDGDRPITEDTLFRIYSMTKPITAVAMMILHEEGLFQLSDPVSRFLPEFDNMSIWTAEGNIDAQGPITMHQLLTHTSGLSYGFSPTDPVDKLYREASKTLPATLVEHSQMIASLPLAFEPGERWHYSVASDILGAVAEKITGQSFEQILSERIFDPLGMNNTFFNVPADKAALVSNNHYWSKKHGALATLPIGGFANLPTSGVTLFLGGHGLISTIGDYMKFAEMMRNGGQLAGKRLLSPRTVEFMSQNHLTGLTQVTSSGEAPGIGQGNNIKGVGFGLGFGVLTDPVQRGVMASEGSYFWGGAAGTVFWIDPAEELVGIAMMQLMGSPWDYRKQMMVLTYQAIIE